MAVLASRNFRRFVLICRIKAISNSCINPSTRTILALSHLRNSDLNIMLCFGNSFHMSGDVETMIGSRQDGIKFLVSKKVTSTAANFIRVVRKWDIRNN